MRRPCIAALFALGLIGLGVAITPEPVQATGITLVARHRLVSGVHEDELPVGSGKWFAIAHVATATPVTSDDADNPYAELVATVSAGNTAVMVVENSSADAGAFATSASDTFESIQSIAALGHTIAIGVVCELAGGSTGFRWTQALGTANSIHVSEYSGAADSACLDGTPVSGSNASTTSPLNSGSVTLGGAGGIVFGAMVGNADPAMTTCTERSESTGAGFTLNSGERADSGGCSWTFADGTATIHLVIGIEAAGGASSFIPGIVNTPIRGGGWLWLMVMILVVI